MKSTKRWAFVLACLMSTSLLQAQDAAPLQPFTIKGTVPPAYKQDTLVIGYFANRVKHWDTVVLASGSFQTTGKVSKPEVGYLMLLRKKKTVPFEEGHTFYLEPNSSIVITGNADWKKFSIRGGPIQQDWARFEKLKNEALKNFPPFSSVKYDTPEGIAFMKKWRAAFVKAQNAFIVANPSSFISWDILKNRTVVIEENPYLLEALLDMVDSSFKTQPEYEGIVRRVAAVKNVVIGKPAPDFESVDTLGVKHTLADFRGKYVFVDFWASWCGFCRAQTPALKKVYEKYKNDNFTVVGISYDDSKARWMKAIHEDNMPWMQLSELKAIPESPSAKAYGINAIPQNVMLDPNGNIVARNISALEFDAKIGEILKGKVE